MDQGFPKTRRLLRRKDFRLVYDTGTPYRNAGFHLFVRPRENAAWETRIGITTTRDLGPAVLRNRVRRWVRETFRFEYPRLRPGFDLVVNCHRSLPRVSRDEFDRCFRNVLHKADLLVGHAPVR
ncbi:ribonuclease P protein component [Candidatus Sumerlaeota bacterium]|nr:ribonuclease P protein component [Candidatus Sumerlaeota bacterium]